MQAVSDMYRESMKSPLREPGYISVYIGVVSQYASKYVTDKNIKSENNLAYYSAYSSVFTSPKTAPYTYATLEQNFTKVDGSMMFLYEQNWGRNPIPLPSVGSSYTAVTQYYDTERKDCIVSSPLISEGDYTLMISFTQTDSKGAEVEHNLAISGFTINFGDNYPVDFDIIGEGDGNSITITDNNSGTFNIMSGLTETPYVKLVVHKMKNADNRLRIYSFLFGYGLSFGNDEVISSSYESVISPIGETLPQSDFSVTLKNYDKYFNVDNPKSPINYLEPRQQITVQYGYELSEDVVEWVNGGKFFLSDWEADDSKATLNAQDLFRQLDTTYEGYVASTTTTTTYTSIVEGILSSIGIDVYDISGIDGIIAYNPIPSGTIKETLQLVANACKCYLQYTREGGIEMLGNFTPTPTSRSVTSYTTWFSHTENVVNDVDITEYGTMATDYTKVDGSMYFLPTSTSSGMSTTGYISDSVSSESSLSNADIIINFDAAATFYNFTITFGNAIPSEIHIYSDGEANFYVTENISKTTTIYHDFVKVNKLVISITSMPQAGMRAVVNHISFGDVTDFTMEYSDMTSSPTAYKGEEVKDITVNYYDFAYDTTELTTIVNSGTYAASSTVDVTFTEPYFGITVTEGTTSLSCSPSRGYHTKFTTTTGQAVTIKGYKLKSTSQAYTVTINERGKSITWDNPLIHGEEQAKDIAEWLADYYKLNISYDYNTRGYPELEANDIIYQQNAYNDNLAVRVEGVSLDFNGAFSGSVTSRRLGG